MTIPTKQKLANALTEAGAPAGMVNRALAGGYDDYESESATPIRDLVHDLQAQGFGDLAKRAINGEFDGTREEGDAWIKREGKDLLR